MQAAPTPPPLRHRGPRLVLIGLVALALVTAVAGCVGPGSAGAGAGPPGGTPTAAPTPSSTRSPSSASTAAPTPAPTPKATPSAAPVVLDPLAEPLVAAGRSLSEGTAGLASVDARTALDQATATLEADIELVRADSAAAAQVDEARIAADIAALVATTPPVRQGVVETAIRVVNEEALNADTALRDSLYLAIVDQQSQTSATDDTPRQVLDLVAKLLAVQESEAAFAAQQQAAAGEQRPDGGGSPDAPAFHTFPPPAPGGPTETYCPDPSRPDYCLPVGPLVPAG